MVITDPAEASTWLLGLGSKLYPGNEPSMLMLRLILKPSKQKKGSADRVYAQ